MPQRLPLLLLAALLALAPRAFAQAATDSIPPPSPPIAVPAQVGTPATPMSAPDTTQPVPLPQAPAIPVTPSSVLGANSPTPSRPHGVTARAEGAVRGERDQMQQMANSADTDLLEAKKQEVQAKGMVEIKKREIETLNARIKAAKQSKDTATRDAFEKERKRQDSMRSFFEKSLDVAEAQIEEAQARGEYARAAMRADDFEVQLAGRAGVATLDADPNLFKLEQQFLDATQRKGSAQEKLANKVQALAGKQLNLYRGWADYLSGK